MRYANIFLDKKRGRVNLGDCMQLLAIDNLLEGMGVKGGEVERIGLSELSCYSGEYVIMPVSFPFASFTNELNITVFSERIIPVFLGLSILADTLSDEDSAYLRSNQPIGCRDMRTLETMRRYGIDAYLNGCMTLTLPRASKGERGGARHVYLADVPDDLLAVVPSELKADARIVSPIACRSQIEGSCEEEAARRYACLIDDARLVITTRLHVALPCFAAGIPVVFLKRGYSYRFAGIDAVVPFFDESRFGEIDWNPSPLDLEAYKTEVLALARRRLTDAMERRSDMCDLSYRLESKERPAQVVESLTNTVEYLRRHWSQEAPRSYVLWGLTQTAQVVFSHISANYPNAELAGVFDLRNHGALGGRKATMPAPLEKPQGPVTVFACAASAASDAREYADASGFACYNCFTVDEGLIRNKKYDA